MSVIGEQFRDGPAVFASARREFEPHIDRWGHQPTRRDYADALTEADVIVSTADHEFFGISVVEAIAAGAYPLLPQRLSYPEILSQTAGADDFIYQGGPGELARRLALLADRLARGDLWMQEPDRGRRAVARFLWKQLAPRLDDAIEQAGRRRPTTPAISPQRSSTS